MDVELEIKVIYCGRPRRALGEMHFILHRSIKTSASDNRRMVIRGTLGYACIVKRIS